MKKILALLLIIIFSSAIAFVALGIFITEVEYENNLEINAPIDAVWDLLTDHSRSTEWMDQLEKFELLEGEHQRVGTKMLLEFESAQDQKPIRAIETITEIEKPQRFAFDMDTDLFTGNTEITLESKGNKTDLTAINKVSGKSVYWRSLLFLIKGHLQSQSQISYDNLKHILEKQKG